VALDPGHSTADPGAVSGDLIEHELTLRLARAIQARLAQRGLTAILTRTSPEPLTSFSHPDPTTRLRLEQEARIAAASGARALISIHFDSEAEPAARPAVGGALAYVNQENHDAASRLLGVAILAELVPRVRQATDYPLADRGVRSDLEAGKSYGHFFILRGPFPSVLVETLVLSDPQEAALLADPATLDVIAEAYAEGIARYLAEAPD
jgi:N-acetylmuramoyl-L-alanine amidase